MLDAPVASPHEVDPRNSILLVDDDPGAIRLMGKILHGVADLRFATNGSDALRQAEDIAPDLILLDAEMPGMSGFQVLNALKTVPALAGVPVIFVTSHTEPEFEASGFDLGASDFIAKPVRAPVLMARVKTQLRVKRLTDELRRFASVDALTGVPNRRSFDEVLAREWKRARSSGEPLAMLMIDVDHFKLYNDCYGHPSGDECLRAIAATLAACCHRPADSIARIGGEEFAMLVPLTSRAGVCHMARRVLDEVRLLGIEHEESPTAATVTVSIGASCYDDASTCWIEPSADSRFAVDELLRCSAADLIKAADHAVYAAKHGGRNQAWLLDIADVETPGMARRATG